MLNFVNGHDRSDILERSGEARGPAHVGGSRFGRFIASAIVASFAGAITWGVLWSDGIGSLPRDVLAGFAALICFLRCSSR